MRAADLANHSTSQTFNVVVPMPRRRFGLLRSMAAGLLKSFAYGVAIGGCIWLTLVMAEQAIGVRSIAVIGVFGAGATVGAWFAQIATFIIARGIFRRLRFVIMLGALTAGTIGFTAFFHFLQYRIYFAQWHEPALTKVWVYQMAFTGFGSIAVFTMMGMWLFWPFAAIVIIAAAWILSRHKR